MLPVAMTIADTMATTLSVIATSHRIQETRLKNRFAMTPPISRFWNDKQNGQSENVVLWRETGEYTCELRHSKIIYMSPSRMEVKAKI